MDTTKRPMWLKCKPCGHHWIGLWTPMLMSVVANMLKTIHCPMCGAGSKNVFTADGPATNAPATWGWPSAMIEQPQAAPASPMQRVVRPAAVRVSIACNDPDNGNFAGRLYAVEYLGMDLVNTYWGSGCKISFPADGVMKISRRKFRFEQRKYWFGNWCWDAVFMRRREAHRLLHYLRDSGFWDCEGGPVHLCRWFDSRSNAEAHRPAGSGAATS